MSISALWNKLTPVQQKEAEVFAHVFGSAFLATVLATYHAGGVQWTLASGGSLVIGAVVAAGRVAVAALVAQFTNSAE